MELDLEEVLPGNKKMIEGQFRNSTFPDPPFVLTTVVAFVAFNLEGFGDGGGCVDAGNASVQIV